MSSLGPKKPILPVVTSMGLWLDRRCSTSASGGLRNAFMTGGIMVMWVGSPRKVMPSGTGFRRCAIKNFIKDPPILIWTDISVAQDGSLEGLL